MCFYLSIYFKVHIMVEYVIELMKERTLYSMAFKLAAYISSQVH